MLSDSIITEDGTFVSAEQMNYFFVSYQVWRDLRLDSVGDNIITTGHKYINRKAVEKMIISTNYRTDQPATYHLSVIFINIIPLTREQAEIYLSTED